MSTPEAAARQTIDAALEAAGWRVQDAKAINLYAGPGVAVREFPLLGGDAADYLLYVEGQAAGVVEAKPEGTTLTGVEIQAQKYSLELPPELPAARRPLPFLYQSTGVETRFTNRLDPEPRSRHVFAFHRPETLAGWLSGDALASPTGPTTTMTAEQGDGYDARATLRARLRQLPPLNASGLWPAQVRAVENLERSLAEDRPRALIQMATGSGKTFTAITAIYRLIKYGGAQRVLFLVDRNNLGKQAKKEFDLYTTPDDGRKFTELYTVQHLTSNKLDPVARVCITTIQRLYSMLRGEAELDPALEEGSIFDTERGLIQTPAEVGYNPAIPIETFDVIFTDECHRSIYNLWRQVLEYFDAYLVGLTATPSKQTFGFFNQNLVMEYNHQQAVADGVNVDYDVYTIRTQITEAGSTVEAGLIVDKRDRRSGKKRWEELDEDLSYGGGDLDRSVVAMDQIRTVVRTFRDKLFSEIFPGRREVPKTLIFAKDDRHAEDIIDIVREEFAKGNDFAQKITYRTTGKKPEELLQEFRISYNPRVVVTVDMIATGTDIKPLEVVMFMRAVKSRNFFEQMKGRGVRVIDATEFQAVTPDAGAKTHFVLVDCVGVTEQNLTDVPSLERQPSVSFRKLLNHVAYGGSDPEIVSSLAGRLARLDRQLGAPERALLTGLAGGISPGQLAAGLVEALDPDRQAEAARQAAGLPEGDEPSAPQVAQAARQLILAALKPLAASPELREKLIELKSSYEQTVDKLSQDAVLEAGFSAAALERARAMVGSWEQFIVDHKNEITALQILYSRPYGRRLRFADVRALAQAIQTPPYAWTPETLWRAYETLDRSKVRGSPGTVLTNLVSLVRFAIHQQDELVPYPAQVEARFADWLAQQESLGRRFTSEQRGWLELIKDQIAGSCAIESGDFERPPFTQRGGLMRVHQVFGEELDALLAELNEVLAA